MRLSHRFAQTHRFVQGGRRFAAERGMGARRQLEGQDGHSTVDAEPAPERSGRRVTDVAEFVDSLQRIANGASVIDPALIQELVSAGRRKDPLAVLSPREHEVLALMAEGRSNAGVARQLWLTEGTVEKHVRSILSKLNLPETADDHRRVRAVITFLESR